MGTKAIEKVLELARRDRLPSTMQICDAERELEAIHKAAVALDDGLPLQVVGVGIQEALDLMTSIAKEGP